MHIAHLHTPSIEANLLTNLPAFLQAQLSAFNHPSFPSISTARLQPQHAFRACVELRSARFGVKPLTPSPADVPRQHVSPPNLAQIQTHRLTCYVECPNQANITAL